MTNARCRVVAAWMAMAIAGPWTAAARAQIVASRAQSDTDGVGSLTVTGMLNPAKVPTGVSVAGVKAYQTPKIDVEISDANNVNRAPTAAEKSDVSGLLDSNLLLSLGVTPANRKDRVKDLNKLATAATNFAKINKANGLTAKATVAVGNANVGNENGTATAIQKVTAKSVNTEGTTAKTTIVAGNAINTAPMVSAVAVNRDPVAVLWTSASDHTVTLDLTGSSFLATTTGPGTTALAVSDFQVSYVDGATDTDVAEPSTPILDVALGVTSTGGDAPSPFGSLLSYTGGTISDSMGGMGMAGVDADLGSILKAMPDGSYAITGSYSIMFDVTGGSSQGVLFLDNYNYGVSAVPEPSSVALMAAGALALAGSCWRRMRRARGPAA